MQSLNTLDRSLSARIHAASSTLVDFALVGPALLCGRFGAPLILAASHWLLDAFALHAFAALATVVVTETMKKATRRPRPAPVDIGARTFNLRGLLQNYAFPSGDSAQAAVLGTVWKLQYAATTIDDGASSFDGNAFYVVTLLAMAGRVHDGCHWIGDTIAGSLIGAAITHAVHAYLVAAT
jgi:membrane-associated phospholipid phosphatase